MKFGLYFSVTDPDPGSGAFLIPDFSRIRSVPFCSPGLSLTGRQTHRVGQLFHKQGGVRSFLDPDLGSVDPDLDPGA
jgi:hypothetical protein